MSRVRQEVNRKWTADDLVREGTRRFRRSRVFFGHGTDNARDEAAWLVSHALGCAVDQLPQRRLKPVPPATAERILRLFSRRITERQPAAYLTREAWLGDVRFYVDERVIVPRSHIAPLLQERLHPWIGRAGRIRSVLDLCTGSGCLAILAARAFSRARVEASDISASALAVAKRNVAAFRLGRRIRLVRSDLFAKLRRGRYDLILCNPPYVTASSMRRLPPEYRHEPALALAGGPDGLSLVRRILAQSRAHLNPGGLLVLEIGRGRARMERAFPGLRFIWPDVHEKHAVCIVEREMLGTYGRGSSSEMKSSRTRCGVSSRN